MKGINDLIKSSGASQTTINIAIVLVSLAFVGFLGLMGFEVVWDTIHGQPLAPWVTTVIGACVIFITTTLTSIHVSNSVEQTVKTTSETTTNASLQAQKQADNHAISMLQNSTPTKDELQQNTAATNANTAATRENTLENHKNE